MKSIVVKFILASFLICILLCIVILYTQYQNSIFDFYSIKIRPYFFTAFLTAGSLILTLKFNILFNIKEKLYNDKRYIEILNEYKKINSNYKKYGPLANLGELLVTCVLACLITAVSQFCIGFIPYWWASVFCIALAIVTMCMIFCTWYHVWCTLKVWFQILRDEED